MKVGININGVLRNFFGRIEKVHTKYFNPEEGKEIFIQDYDLEKWLWFPEDDGIKNEIEFNPGFDEKEFLLGDTISQAVQEVQDPITVDDFLYERCCLEIFGSADEEIDGAVQAINDLELHLTMSSKEPNEVVIISREAGRSVPATLFFLSKTGSMVRNIRFTLGTTDCWQYVDIMVTDHPEIIKAKPAGKIVIKIEKPFNQEIPADYTVKTVKELIGLEIFN